MSMGRYQLLVDFDADGDYFDAEEDVISDVLTIDTKRGRDYASQLTGRATAGTLQATLLNTSGKYSPFNSSSPIYGNLLPGRKVRLMAGMDYSATVLADSPLGYWRCGEASGNLVDSGSGNKPFSAVDGPTYGHRSLIVDPDNDAIDLSAAGYFSSASVSTTNTTSVTLECWVYVSSLTALHGAFLKIGDINSGYGIGIGAGDWDNGGNHIIGLYEETPNGWINTSVDLSVGVHHVVMVINASALAPKFYLDGALVYTASQSDAPAHVPANNQYIGYSKDSRRFAGMVDEVALYTTELSAARVLAHYQAGYNCLWSGFLDRIEPQTVPGPYRTASLYASGAFAYLATKRVNPAGSSDTGTGGDTTGTLIGTVLTTAGWPTLDRAIDTGQTTTGRWYVIDGNCLDALHDLEETEAGFLYESADGKIVFEDRIHRLSGAHVTSQATFSDAGAATKPYIAIVEQDPLRQIFNEVTATVPNYTIAGTAVLWTLTGETPVLAPGESRTFIAQTSALFATDWTPPVVGTDITQTGVANGDIGVSVVERPKYCNITITNNNAVSYATLTLVRIRGDAASSTNPVLVTATDSTSQTKYGQRTYRLPAPWLATSANGQDYCDYTISRYKNPTPVLSISIASSKNTTLMLEALTRAISDRVTVVANNNATLGINEDFYIEAISHRIDEGGTKHITTFDLSPASLDAGYWILGTGTLGTTTKLGY